MAKKVFTKRIKSVKLIKVLPIKNGHMKNAINYLAISVPILKNIDRGKGEEANFILSLI